MNPTDTLRPARVTIDDETIFDALVEREPWNGFVRPAFSFEEAIKVGKAFGMWYDCEKDLFVNFHPDYPFDFEQAETYGKSAEGLYFIGAGYWVWDFAEGQENPFE